MLAPAPDPAPLSIAALPHDVMLDVCELLTDPHDQAALCLADPRLGLAALRLLPSFKDPLTSIALALWSRGGAFEVLDEALLRRYAADRRATVEGAAWLKAAADSEGWPLHLNVVSHWLLADCFEWRLDFMDLEVLLRIDTATSAHHFEGDYGFERRVRIIYPNNGVVQHFEGEKGAERKVRTVRPNGMVQYFEGENGSERVVRLEIPSGQVQHYEGEKGAERLVRVERSRGQVQHFEGEKGAERKVRTESLNGKVRHFEGERKAERKVRAVWPDGQVDHFEGETGAERLVRVEFRSRQAIRKR